MNDAERKIEKILEEFELPGATKNALKAAGYGALGGALGAALDVYFNDSHGLKQFIKPITAWATGGAIGSLLQSVDEEKEKNMDKKG